ncbi:nucleotidyltransferase domain-containing protein [Azospirillum sp. HJ39]|uniref:nucleotidyltransferase family protein n=1 Tax=Azospirillum sp. HJ39 TaxID=3159496 RepID=UPI0035586C51
MSALAGLYGSVARGEDRPDSDLDVAVVAVEEGLEKAVGAVRDALHPAGETLGFSPSVVGLGTGDVERLAWENDPWWTGVAADALAVFGPRPDEIERPSGTRDGRAAA